MMKSICLILLPLIALCGCNNSSEPINSSEVKLVLTSDKTIGSAPITILRED